MSIWNKLLDGLASSAGGVLGSVADWALGQFSGLSKSQRQQNEYASHEAQLARDFNAQQAELEREWQAEQSYMYNSLQGKIAQANEAGVNPMFAVTGSAVSPASSSGASASASPASSTSVNPQRVNPAVMQQALGFSKLSAEIENIKSITRKTNAEALTSEINNLTQGELNRATISSVLKSIEVADVDISVKNAEIANLASMVDFRKIQGETESARAALFREQISEVVASVAKMNAERGVMEATVPVLQKQIEQMDVDISYKVQAAAELMSQILVNDAQKDLYHQMTRTERQRTGLVRSERKLTAQQIKESKARVREISSRIANMNADTDLKEMQTAYQELLNIAMELSPATNDSWWFDFTRWMGNLTDASNVSFNYNTNKSMSVSLGIGE